jgi:hypothetical protein
VVYCVAVAHSRPRLQLRQTTRHDAAGFRVSCSAGMRATAGGQDGCSGYHFLVSRAPHDTRLYFVQVAPPFVVRSTVLLMNWPPGLSVILVWFAIARPCVLSANATSIRSIVVPEG